LIAEVQEEQGVIINLSQDSFYRNLTPQETADIANFNFDHPNAFAFDEIIHCLGQLKQANPVEIPQYDFVTSSRTGQIPVQHADVILSTPRLCRSSLISRSLWTLMLTPD